MRAGTPALFLQSRFAGSKARAVSACRCSVLRACITGEKGIVRGVSRYRSVGKALVSSLFLLFGRQDRKGVKRVCERAREHDCVPGTANKTRGCRGRDMLDNEMNGRVPLK